MNQNNITKNNISQNVYISNNISPYSNIYLSENSYAEFYNMAFFIIENAKLLSDKVAVSVANKTYLIPTKSYSKITFSELNSQSDKLAYALSKIGIKPKTKVLIMIPPIIEFFVATFALFKIGAIVIMIDPGMGFKNLAKCVSEVQPEVFLGTTKAHIARILFKLGRKSIKTNITIGPKLFWGGFSYSKIINNISYSQPYPIYKFRKDELGAIFFTSGSTGIAKGAEYTHLMLTQQVNFIKQMFNFSPTDVDLATFPLFALIDVCLGLTAVIPDMNASKPALADPRKIITAIEDNNANIMFGSPALINNLSRYCEITKYHLKTLNKVISCGAPARNNIIQRLQNYLPLESEIYTPYGATEALPVSNISSRVILSETKYLTDKGFGNCVGYPHPKVEVKIIKISDDPIEHLSEDLFLPPKHIGEIIVTGDIVSKAYYNRPSATKLAKIIDPKTNQIWHRMGDLGYFDEIGRLWFVGRKSQRVTTPKKELYTIQCEAIFNTHPLVARSALVGIGKRPNQIPVIVIEINKENFTPTYSNLIKELSNLAKSYPHTSIIEHFLIYPYSFPVDVRHNSKINRELLAIWAEQNLKS